MPAEENVSVQIKGEDPSKKFHDRVKKIFVNAGFNLIKSDYYAKGADIIVEVDNKKIIIQCKCAWSDDKSGLSIDSLIDEYSKKADKENAERAILAISRYKIPSQYMGEEARKNRARNDKVVIWDDSIIDYYEEVVSALNEWAKYSILGDLEIVSKFGGPIYSPYIKIQQGEFDFLVFKISPEDLLKISYIFRRDYSQKAYQRALNLRRLKKDIAEFLDSEEAILPSNLIGVFNSDIKFKGNMLVIPSQYKSFWIIDGQHRLYSFCYTKDQIKKSNFELLCVGLDGRTWKESKQAKLFVDINDKPKRISKLLLYDLYELIGFPEMRVELVKKLARESKVFKNKIKMKRKDKGEISLVTFVSTTPMNGLTSEKNGDLGNLFKEKFNQYPDYSKASIREKCKDFYFKTLNEYFELVKDNLKEQWEDGTKYVLSTDRGIRVLLRLLRKLYRYNVVHDKKRGDQEIFVKVMSAIKDFDFSSVNLKSNYLGEGGSDVFLNDLILYIQKTIPDFFPKEDKNQIHNISVEAGDKIKANQLINTWLPMLGKEVFGELPYINHTTFDYLSKLPSGCTIKLFVSEIWSESECKKKYDDLVSKGYNIEIRRITKGPFKDGQKKIKYLHNRWIGGYNFEIEPHYDLMSDSLGNTKDKMELYSTKNSERINTFKERWNVVSQFKNDVLIENVFK